MLKKGQLLTALNLNNAYLSKTNTASQTVIGPVTFSGGITGSLSGNASTASRWATGRTITLTGEVTAVSSAWTGSANLSIATTIANGAVVTDKIANANVTYAKIQNVTANRILGRISSNGTIQELTAANVRSMINVADGADKYTSWNLYMNDTSRASIGSGGIVNLKAGSNVSLTYSASNNTITIASTDTNTATAIDNILDGSNSGTAITYAPYTTNLSTTGNRFYTHNTMPTATTLLNLSSHLRITQGTIGTTLTVNGDIIGNGKVIARTTDGWLRLNPTYTSSPPATAFHSGVLIPSALSVSGNVGIGTTAPAYKLDVSGDVRATGKVTTRISSGGASIVDGSSNSALRIETTSTSVAPRFGISWSKGTDHSYTIAAIEPYVNSGWPTDLRFLLSSNGSNIVEQMRLYANGNLSFSGTLTGGTVPWARISGAPATATTHPTWAQVTGKPSTFAPSTHTHSNITITAGNGLSGGGTLDANRTITLGTPGTLNASTTNAVQASSHTHSVTGFLPLTGGTLTGSVAGTVFTLDRYIPSPQGGRYATTTSSATGAIKITLPVSWNNTMLRFAVDVYNYSANTSFTVYVGGYNYSSSSAWVNTFAYILARDSGSDYTVRFGHDGSKCCVYIGETNKSWSYPQIVVRDVHLGYSGRTSSLWDTGWSIGFATSFGTITSTISDCMVYSRYAKTAGSVAWGNVTGKPSTFAPSSHSHGAGDLPSATTSAKGVVQLSTSTSSTSTTLAATASAVKAAYDVGNHSHPYAPSSHTHTASQVGLGNVQNYGIATKAQAEAGTANSVYMTPLRVKEAIASQVPDLPSFYKLLDSFISSGEVGIDLAAGIKNSMYRGKNLGTSVTSEQWANIANGTFKDMYIGDYWVINGTTYIIAAFNYYLNTSGTLLTTKHVTLVTAESMYTHRMNTKSLNDEGYVGSEMYTTGLDEAKTRIHADFAGHVLTHKRYLCNAVADGQASAAAWFDSDVELMNEVMVYGSIVNGKSDYGYNIGVEKSQLPLFALRPDLVNIGIYWWLRDVVSALSFAAVGGNGLASRSSNSNARGVRPVFSIF